MKDRRDGADAHGGAIVVDIDIHPRLLILTQGERWWDDGGFRNQERVRLSPSVVEDKLKCGVWGGEVINVNDVTCINTDLVQQRFLDGTGD